MAPVEAERVKEALSLALAGDVKSQLFMIDTFRDTGTITAEARTELIAWATGNKEPAPCSP